ncbi:ankyrin repeat domain-containing protein [Candidatus Micrarchaeota archaeon]|nr:ankyrin repeat domain-containing protein [Candidatus Micrarchaeota archaeon]
MGFSSLISKGADINAKDRDGETQLFIAASIGRLAVAELLIAHGADTHAENNHGFKALSPASRYGHKEVVELLISKGANINAKTRFGQPPLFFAIDMNCP